MSSPGRATNGAHVISSNYRELFDIFRVQSSAISDKDKLVEEMRKKDAEIYPNPNFNLKPVNSLNKSNSFNLSKNNTKSSSNNISQPIKSDAINDLSKKAVILEDIMKELK